MWSHHKAREVLSTLLPFVDYCSAGKLDAIHLIGIEEKSNNQDDLIYYYEKMKEHYPDIKLFYSTMRQVESASHHTLIGTIWSEGMLYSSRKHIMNPIVDRVGGGDAFAAGILHGLLTKKNMDYTVTFATAASALKHTINEDCNQFSMKEIEAFMNQEEKKILR
jgi:2-dehydro-3-deoxygluconokinase